jgi:hypothetical protein
VLDEEIPTFWRSLGIPGLIDIHVHFMPDRVQEKVWSFFDTVGPRTGIDWPISYRLPDAVRLELLRAWGVRAFPALSYPHKSDMAAWLNGWALGFADAEPDVVPAGTFFPEPSATDYVAAALEDGVRIFKAHLQVGGYDPRDRLLQPVWGQLTEVSTRFRGRSHPVGSAQAGQLDRRQAVRSWAPGAKIITYPRRGSKIVEPGWLRPHDLARTNQPRDSTF